MVNIITKKQGCKSSFFTYSIDIFWENTANRTDRKNQGLSLIVSEVFLRQILPQILPAIWIDSSCLCAELKRAYGWVCGGL